MPGASGTLGKCRRKNPLAKAVAQNLSIEEATAHRHLARVRKIFAAHSNIELLRQCKERTEADMSATRVTPRGREVSELAMHCLNSKEISKRLGISHSGILRHRENMFL